MSIRQLLHQRSPASTVGKHSVVPRNYRFSLVPLETQAILSCLVDALECFNNYGDEGSINCGATIFLFTLDDFACKHLEFI